MSRIFPLLLLPLLICGCPQDEDKKGTTKVVVNPVSAAAVIGPVSGGTPAANGGVPVNITVDGVVLYQRLQVTGSGLGATPLAMPVRNAPVEIVAHDDINNVLATTTTDASGNYTVNLLTDVDYFVRARAESANDRVRHSGTVPALVWAVTTQIQNRGSGSQTINLLASSSLPVNRSGAFAILDTLVDLRAATGATGVCEAFWAPGNIGSSFQKDANGDAITVSTQTVRNAVGGLPVLFFVGGDPNDPFASDHDEYDVSVIAHEWAHWLMMTESRDNNPQGQHAGEDILPVSAYSEGLASALGPALLGLTRYRDTRGYPGGSPAMEFEFDLESGINPGAGSGYTGEFNIARAAFDLMDDGTNFPADGDGDGVSVDRADFLASLRALATRTAPYEVAWFASFLQQLIDDGHLTIMQANTLMTAQGASFPPTGGVDPFPTELTVAGPTDSATLDAWGGSDPNPVLSENANGMWRFTLASATSVTVDVTVNVGSYDADANRVDLLIYDLNGVLVAAHQSDTQNKSATVALATGTYVVRAWHRPKSQTDSTPTMITLGVQ